MLDEVKKKPADTENLMTLSFFHICTHCKYMLWTTKKTVQHYIAQLLKIRKQMKASEDQPPSGAVEYILKWEAECQDVRSHNSFKIWIP